MVKVAPSLSSEWQVVQVDLWKALQLQRPASLQGMLLTTSGGPVLIDQVIIGQDEADLPRK